MESLFGFQGTISRSQFWLAILVASLAAIPLATLPILLDLLVPGTMAVWFFVILFGLYWVYFALHAKRVRDAGLSPWLSLLYIVPLANLAVFLIAGIKPTAVERTDAPTRLD